MFGSLALAAEEFKPWYPIWLPVVFLAFMGLMAIAYSIRSAAGNSNDGGDDDDKLRACSVSGCFRKPSSESSGTCAQHGQLRKCVEPGCEALGSALHPWAGRCYSHSYERTGLKWCATPGCYDPRTDGTFCSRHSKNRFGGI